MNIEQQFYNTYYIFFHILGESELFLKVIARNPVAFRELLLKSTNAGGFLGFGAGQMAAENPAGFIQPHHPGPFGGLTVNGFRVFLLQNHDRRTERNPYV